MIHHVGKKPLHCILSNFPGYKIAENLCYGVPSILSSFTIAGYALGCHTHGLQQYGMHRQSAR